MVDGTPVLQFDQSPHLHRVEQEARTLSSSCPVARDILFKAVRSEAANELSHLDAARSVTILQPSSVPGGCELEAARSEASPSVTQRSAAML